MMKKVNTVIVALCILAIIIEVSRGNEPWKLRNRPDVEVTECDQKKEKIEKDEAVAFMSAQQKSTIVVF